MAGFLIQPVSVQSITYVERGCKSQAVSCLLIKQEFDLFPIKKQILFEQNSEHEFLFGACNI